jgi:hypothetical protein
MNLLCLAHQIKIAADQLYPQSSPDTSLYPHVINTMPQHFYGQYFIDIQDRFSYTSAHQKQIFIILFSFRA